MKKEATHDNKVAERIIPVAFAVNDNYLKYASVTIASILHYQKEDERYFFYILHRNICQKHQTVLKDWITAQGAFVEFINVREKIDSRLLYVSGYVTEETYYRILIPELLPEWEKIIYMDCDIICLSNLGDILDITEFDEDTWLAGTMASRNEGRNNYCMEHLGIPSDTYIFAGMLIMNVRKLNETRFREKCLDFLKEKKWLKQHDMDLINAVGYGHIQILDQYWHTTVGAIAYNAGISAELLKKKDINCCMLHYATLKPWTTELIEVTLPFWQYVFCTPFSTEISEAYREISDTKKHFSDMCKRNEISLAFLIDLFVVALKERLKREKSKNRNTEKIS